MPGNVFQKGTLLIHTGPHAHLHIVMNDPVHCTEMNDSSVLVVNISSVKQGEFYDPSCVLMPGCHPFVRLNSWVMYSHAAVLRVPRIDQKLADGEFQTHHPMNQASFDSVRAGFDVSEHVKFKISRYIRVHGI